MRFGELQPNGDPTSVKKRTERKTRKFGGAVKAPGRSLNFYPPNKGGDSYAAEGSAASPFPDGLAGERDSDA